MNKTRLASVLAVLAIGAATLPGAARAQGPMTIAQMASVVGDRFDLPAPPAHLSAEQRSHWVTHERPMLGRTPAAWIEWAQQDWAQQDVTLERIPRAARTADLTTEVLRIYAAVGRAASASDVVAIERAAASLPRAVRDGFAKVVATVARAYEQQLPLVAAVQTRITKGFDPLLPLVTPVERDLMAARGQQILGAIARFRHDVLDNVLRAPKTNVDAPLFSDPEGLVILGGTGAGEYVRGGMLPDPVLVIEPSGSDVYKNSAGGACPVTVGGGPGGEWMECNSLAISVVADLGSAMTDDDNDTYRFDGPPSVAHGAGGPAGIGILVDVAGNDTYDATMTRSNTSTFFQYFDGGAQGFGYAGFGLQLDILGDDYYRFLVDTTNRDYIWALGQGFGGGGGLGILSDLTGADRYEDHALGHQTDGFVGVYTNGGGFYGGVGIQTDTGLGNDEYFADAYGTTTDYYAQGFGAFGGLGILVDDGGNDDYYAYESATNSFINPLLNCAYGTASFAGVGVMIEGGGNDHYYAGTRSTRRALVMGFGAGGPGVAYGVFADLGGNDIYEMEAFGTYKYIWGHGLYEPEVGGDPVNNPLGENTFGAYVDIGGDDTYIGTDHDDNTQWTFGIDRGV